MENSVYIGVSSVSRNGKLVVLENTLIDARGNNLGTLPLPAAITAVAVSPEGSLVVAGGADSALHFFSVLLP